MRIVFLAGGSGGHISPALAVAHEIRRQQGDAECIFLCSQSRLDRKILSQSGERFIPIFSGKIRRYFSWQNFIDPLFLFFGFFQCLFLFLFRRPDVVFSKGGFVAVPPAFAAYVLRVPIIVHESDSVPGLANKIVQRFAKTVLTTFPGDFSFSPDKGGSKGDNEKKKLPNFQWTGLPIRQSLLQADAEKGKQFLSFSDAEKPILLGFGGSQGSDFLNKKIIQNIDSVLLKANVVWICGLGQKSFSPQRKDLRVFEYLHEEFPHVLAAADLVITRSGSSIFEVAALKKPMLLIPLASAASNHQEKNAEVFAFHNAAEVLLEKDCDSERSTKTIIGLLGDVDRRKRLGENAYELVRFDAAEKIAKEIIFAKTSKK